MKKFLPFILLISIGAGAQLQRYDSFSATTTSASGIGNLIQAIPNATLTVFNYPGAGTSCAGGGCVAATTFTSRTGATACGAAVPLTRPTSTTCIATADSQGNFGFWAAAGNYQYCIAATSFTTTCYNIVVGPAADAANIQYANQFAGADACAKIQAAHAILAAGSGGIIDASGFVGSQTCAAGLTLGTTAGPIVLRLASAFFSIPSNPCVSIVAGTAVTITGMGEEPTSSVDPTINCTSSTAGAIAIKWLGSRGGMEKVQIQTPNTMIGMTLDANAAGQDVKFNTFKDLSFNSSPSNTNDGIQLNALDATHKVSFNNFINVEEVDFQQGFDLTMQSGGSFGPTDNAWFGGQARRTTAAAGTGIAVGQAAQNNWFFGGNYSFFTTGISIAAFSTTVQNNFYGTIVESIGTTPCSIGAGAADNHFYGVSCSAGGLNSIDSGNSTLFDNVTLSGVTLSKIGRPLAATPFAGCAVGLPAATAGGTGMWLTGNCVSPVAGKIYVGDGTGFQVNFSKRTASTDTDFWFFKDNGQILGQAGSALGFAATLMSATAPTIAAGGCGGSAASIPANNGTAAFKINVGTAPTASCTVTMPSATTGWNCHAEDITTQTTAIFVQKQTGAESQTSVTLTNFNDVAVSSAFAANDILKVTCAAD